MDDKSRRYMSDPDENGIRYFDIRRDGVSSQETTGHNTAASADEGTSGNDGTAEIKNTGASYASGGGSTGSSSGWVSTGRTGDRGGNGGKSGGRSPKFWRNVSIVLAIILAVVCITSAVKNAVWGALGIESKSSFSYSNLPNSPYIATMYVEGTIQEGNVDYFGRGYGYQHQWTIDTIDDLMYDDDNYGLIIFINSPGGTIYESDELYLKIKEYQEYTGRSVYAVMGSMAASGGYYISAPCDKIYANRNTWTGSIGVTIGTIVDFSQFLENYGIRTKTITSGANKAMGSSYQAMTAEEEAIWRGLVNEAYDQFVEVVADGRGMSMQDVYKIADGRIYSAKQAVKIGLIDELGEIDDAYYDMYDKIISEESDGFGSPSYVERVDVMYETDDTSLSWLFGSMLQTMEKINGGGEKDSVIELAESINSHPASYLCEMLAD